MALAGNDVARAADRSFGLSRLVFFRAIPLHPHFPEPVL